MALNIDKATIGFDTNNIEQALRNLNSKVIQDTIKDMNEGMGTLRGYVDSAWRGKSAENFKKNLDKDRDIIVEALQETYEVLKSRMYEIANAMAEVDSELVKERKS